MATENVDLVRGIYEEFNRGSATLLSLFHDEVEWHTAADLPDSDTHRGPGGVRALIEDWATSFKDFRADVHEVIDRGEYVVVSLDLRGRAIESGDDLSLPETHVWKIRDGLVIEVREYRTLDAALEAVAAATAGS